MGRPNVDLLPLDTMNGLSLYASRQASAEINDVPGNSGDVRHLNDAYRASMNVVCT